MSIIKGSRPNGTAAPHSSKIKVIVVGTGLAGLATAVECHRKGHSVTLLERHSEVPTNGDGIGISPNAARIIRKWGNGVVNKHLQDFASDIKHVHTWSHTGKYINPTSFDDFTGVKGYLIHRASLIRVMYEHAKFLGIDIQHDSSVTDYWETGQEAGVVVNGEKVVADCVICAEGIHSRGRSIITKSDFQEPQLDPIFSTFRGTLDTEALRQDPETRWAVESESETTRDVYKVWTTHGMHLSIFTAQRGNITVWYAAHKDKALMTKSELEMARQSPNIETAIGWIREWPLREKLEPILRKADNGRFIQAQISSYQPLKTWRSPLGRMMVIGDAAHPTPPASAQSGSQAIEDGAVVAIALELAGKNDVPLALEVTEKIRYPRATAVQEEGRSIQEDSFEKPEYEPEGRPEWMWDHDCQESTYREYELVAGAIRSGQNYIPTNCPALIV
ncbi:FAD/NAD(P)-binding domain-containing protein [Penicillium angulare]|uniref:FAD/NAD(P)-binding domain-containing protein n=1 Tax=Penicillium angulare TaxID=116970 RepID=UPI002540DC0C|nr:FAD/NAD(P)-binding domain-containing protein [Penicillium angulare]KAJ5290961.1 FAD/NAD(P)-binding domain-containing protein [Penicillium angulare]